MHQWAIRAFGGEEGIEGQFNGEKVLINVQVLFDVSPEITVFYMHLTLRDEIRATVQDSPNAYVMFDAGTHIGYIYPPPTSSFYTLDFGVQDQNMDAGLTRDPKEWWNTSVNPLDYFVDDLRKSILEAYRPTYDTLVEVGTFPYSDIEDSRQNINEQGTIWGVWFKDDLIDVWDGSAWSVVNLVKKAELHQATYWRTLQEFPTMSGLFVEEARGEAVGQRLYEGQPIRLSKFYIISGNEMVGVARIEEDWGDSPRTVYLKYEALPNTASKFDDTLIMESFQTFEAAEAGDFSDNAVTFRREPCKNSACS